MSSKTELNKCISKIDFTDQLIEFWNDYDGDWLTVKRMYCRFSTVWKYFWQKYRMNKNQFNEIFLETLRVHRCWIRLHGAPTGSFNHKSWLRIPDENKNYTSYAGMVFGLWSLDERYQPKTTVHSKCTGK